MAESSGLKKRATTMTEMKHLLSPFQLGGVPIKNRIVFSPHGTGFAEQSAISERHLAYHEARAAGGAGLIITEQNAVHPTTELSKWLSVADDQCIPGLSELARTVHRHDCKLFAQLMYSGRSTQFRRDGVKAPTYSVSALPDERFRQVPVEMSVTLIEEVISSFGDAALRARQAGLDGVEIQAAFSYLPAHFLNPRTNQRTDEYGGSFDNRLRFLRGVFADIRSKVGPDMVIGARMSGDEMDHDGLTPQETIENCAAFDADGVVDYFNLGCGSDTSLKGWVTTIPPSPYPTALLTDVSAQLKARLQRASVIVAGRINDPRIAEQVIAEGRADLVGMARALICDPEFANKTMTGRLEDIRACIGCNQACIGHREAAIPVSCIQYPESGRESRFLHKPPATQPRNVLVVGGGPAGMKTAAVAAERGHSVTLFEKSARLGGQVKLAQLLPGRSEFGGLIGNFERELERAQVKIHRNVTVTEALVLEQAPDVVVVATGSRSRAPSFEGADRANVVDPWQVITGEAKTGGSVLIADWACDWVGLGLAEKLAREGCHVRLCATGMVPGELIPQGVRGNWIGELHKLGVEIVPYARLFGADEDTVYLQHVISEQPIIYEGVETLIPCIPQQSDTELAQGLVSTAVATLSIGDCLSPRTAEEAIYEGLTTAMAL